MKKIIKDLQLDDELQELYLECKHWLSDIHFEEDEIRFLRKVIDNYLVPGLKNEQLIEINNFNGALAQQDANIPYLKSKITGLLKLIGILINETDKEIRIELVEQFATLETEMKTLFEAVKQIKKLLFLFTEEVMRTGCEIVE
ncbi:MAG: hypothetical protein JWQ63_1232 [Mucilaginibacter sp.]|nr:hypothetical protein [Mucilaginibacter sp.]